MGLQHAAELGLRLERIRPGKEPHGIVIADHVPPPFVDDFDHVQRETRQGSRAQRDAGQHDHHRHGGVLADGLPGGGLPSSRPQVVQELVGTRDPPTLEESRKRIPHDPRRSRAEPSPPARNSRSPPRSKAYPSPQFSQTPATRPQKPARDRNAFTPWCSPSLFSGERTQHHNGRMWTGVNSCERSAALELYQVEIRLPTSRDAPGACNNARPTQSASIR